MTETSCHARAHKYPHSRIIVFARAPVAGKVKTRLAETVGDEAAVRVYRELLSTTAAMASNSCLAGVTLYVSGGSDHPWIKNLANRYGIKLADQHGRNLGERMYNALTDVLDQADYCILIGTDCPGMEAGYIDRALASLERGGKVVIGPAEDGGYVLIGVRHAKREWFELVDWGTSRVLEQTRDRIQSSGWPLEQLNALWDVDSYEDFLRWQSHTGSSKQINADDNGSTNGSNKAG